MTLTQILSDEMTRCLREYKQLAEAADKETLNHRYLCLQTALWMEAGGTAPAIRKSDDEVRYIIRRWMTDIQRDSTVATMHHDGRVVALLSEFLDATKPVTAVPAQQRLI